MRRPGILRVVALCAAFAWAVAGTSAMLFHEWRTSYLYSYGPFVPLISGYIIWARRQMLRDLPVMPDYRLGVPLTLIGVVMLIVGNLAAVASIEESSLAVMLAGLLLILFGRALVASIWFPLAYLLAAIPVWTMVIDRIYYPSQVISGQIATTLLHAAGITSYREGTLIELPNVTLDVLQACSGVNQVVAMLVVIVPATYLWMAGWVRRVSMIVIAILVAYLSNGVRIAVVGVLATKGLNQTTIGGWHVAEGLLTSAAGYVVAFVCFSALSRQASAAGSQAGAHEAPGPRQIRSVLLRVEAGVLLLIVVAGTYRYGFEAERISPGRSLHQLPQRIGDWTRESILSHFAYRLATVDDEVSQSYANAAGQQLELYIGYQRYQTEGKEVADENGRALSRQAVSVPLRLDSGSVELGEVLQRTPTGKRGIVYWYDINGRVTPDRFRAKAYTVWDALMRRRTNGAVVMVKWEAALGSADEPSRRAALDFVTALLRILPDYLTGVAFS